MDILNYDNMRYFALGIGFSAGVIVLLAGAVWFLVRRIIKEYVNNIEKRIAQCERYKDRISELEKFRGIADHLCKERHTRIIK
jgi:hypothetical protein